MVEYTCLRSKRKSLSIEVHRDGRVIVRVPMQLAQSRVEEFVAQHEAWLEEKLREAQRCRPDTLTDAQIAALKKKAAEQLPAKTAYYARLMGVQPAGVKITSAQKRFGSCSGKNSICYSYQVMRYADAAIDYVVVHELAHIVHKNHSRDFYALVESILPDYRARAALLREKPEI